MPRKIWISTIAFQRSAAPTTIAENVAKARALLERACATGPDIVCLPETFAYVGVPHRAADVAEPVPGPITAMAAEVARRHQTHVICPLLELRGGRVYNAAVLLDRQGRIAGTYDKVRPVTTTSDYTELERGVTPGKEPRVFDTDFGRIGILICFDITFPVEWARMKAMGAEVVFWPSAYNGGFPLRVFAALHSYYVVSSVQSDSAAVIDITGEILAQTDRFNPVVSRQIDLEKGLYHTDFNAKLATAIPAKYGRDVVVRTYGDEGMMTVESMCDGLSVADIEAEFGMEPLAAYRARNDALHQTLLAGREPEPQLTPYLDRAKSD